MASVAALACIPSFAVPKESGGPSKPALLRSSTRLVSSLYLDVEAAGRLLIAVGERGLVVRSVDGGRHWTQAQVPTSVTLTSIASTPRGVWWAAGHGGVLLQSEEGGVVWKQRLDEPGLSSLLSEEVRASPADAGASSGVPDGVDKPLLAVRFFSDMHGMAVGAYGIALVTRDGGKSWQSVQSRMNNPSSLHLYSIAGDGHSIYVVGERGLVRRSDDAGASFLTVSTPYEGTYFKVVKSGQRVCVLGMRGNVYWSDDRGGVWHRSNIQTAASITGAIVEEGNGLVAVDEAGKVHVSANGGLIFELPIEATHSPLTSVVRALDGALVVTGARGLMRVNLRKP